MSWVLQSGPVNLAGYQSHQVNCLTAKHRITIDSMSIGDLALFNLSASTTTANVYSGVTGDSGYSHQLQGGATASLMEFANGAFTGTPTGTSVSPSAPSFSSPAAATSVEAIADGAGVLSISFVYSGTTYTTSCADTGVKSGLFAGVKCGGTSTATGVRLWSWDSGAAPNAPSDLSFSGVTSTGTTVTITPAATGDAATGYRLSKRVAGGSWGAAVSQTSPVFSVTGLTANTVYEYKAVAYNGSGDSAYGTAESQGTLNPATGGGGDLSSSTAITLSPAKLSMIKGETRRVTVTVKSAGVPVSGYTPSASVSTGSATVTAPSSTNADGQTYVDVTANSNGRITVSIT